MTVPRQKLTDTVQFMGDKTTQSLNELISFALFTTSLPLYLKLQNEVQLWVLQ